MESQQIKQIILRELPTILQHDRDVQELILQLSKEHFADREETDRRFDRILDELAHDREEQKEWWAEQNKRWAEQNERWAEQNERWVEQSKRWAEQDKRWEEQNERWAEHNERWEDQNKKWAENQATIHQMLEAIQTLSRKHDSTIGALGARWGLYSEAAFRNGLKGILEESFDVRVLNVVEYDEQGEIFGRPDQIELDIIIKDGQLIICEIKSSMSKSDMYTFERKARFYERLHSRTADRMLVISPMVDKRALVVADNLGIQVYSYADSVDPEFFNS